MIDIGNLRHRVIIEALDLVNQNSRGEPTQSATTVATVWAEIKPLIGRELFTAQQRAAQVTHGVRMRYPGTPVTPEMRLNFNGRYFDILSVLNIDERNRELQILAKERL
ncbi:MAG TPA: phage head closure protein [Thermoanaerobaculia bacterium]|nr:phage head closure protein [Thermoanaerobaculia bacterium]